MPKKSFLTAGGWCGDAPASNKIDATRSTLLANDIHLLGRLHLDLFQQDKLILPHVDMKLRLMKAPDAFSLLHVAGTPADKLDVKIKILECLLLVKSVSVNPDVSLAQETALQKGPARYPIRRSLVRYFPIASASLTATIDNVTGAIPTLIIVGLVPSQAVSGRLHLSGFAFEHHNVNRFACFVGGTPHPIHPFRPDFENNCYVRSYLSLFEATSHYLSNDGGPDISYKDYANDNYVLWAVNLAQDDSNGSSHINPERHGTIRLEFGFRTQLTEATTVICYMEFQNEVTISATREVGVDF